MAADPIRYGVSYSFAPRSRSSSTILEPPSIVPRNFSESSVLPEGFTL